MLRQIRMMPAAPSEEPTTTEPPITEPKEVVIDELEESGMFRLYFIRHTPAEAPADFEGPDAQRPLTKRGRKKLREAREGLRALIGVPDAIITSPYARSQETAEIVAKSLRFAGAVELNDHLVHGGDPHMLASILDAHTGERDLILVGHSPDLERWIAHLTTGDEANVFLEMKKGGVCRVDVLTHAPALKGVLRWAVPPSVLRSLS
ncbi:MAG: histidine phosphatase family protein [Candidatus Thermoplasmatota archaeon]